VRVPFGRLDTAMSQQLLDVADVHSGLLDGFDHCQIGDGTNRGLNVGNEINALGITLVALEKGFPSLLASPRPDKRPVPSTMFQRTR